MPSFFASLLQLGLQTPLLFLLAGKGQTNVFVGVLCVTRMHLCIHSPICTPWRSPTDARPLQRNASRSANDLLPGRKKSGCRTTNEAWALTEYTCICARSCIHRNNLHQIFEKCAKICSNRIYAWMRAFSVVASTEAASQRLMFSCHTSKTLKRTPSEYRECDSTRTRKTLCDNDSVDELVFNIASRWQRERDGEGESVRNNCIMDFHFMDGNRSSGRRCDAHIASSHTHDAPLSIWRPTHTKSVVLELVYDDAIMHKHTACVIHLNKLPHVRHLVY